MTFFVSKLANGKVIQTNPAGEILMKFSSDGLPEYGNLTSSEMRELAATHARAFYQHQDDLAQARASDPRYESVKNEILYRATPSEVREIDSNPFAFNAAFEQLHGEVGLSLKELQDGVDREDEVSSITDKLADKAERGLSQPLEDIARLIEIRELNEKER